MDQFAAAGLRADLDRARRLEVIHRHEGIRRRLADGEQAVVAQDQVRVAAEVAYQPRLLVVVEGRALEVVIAEAAQHGHGVLRDRQQALGLGRHRNAVQGVGVQHEPGVVTGSVDGAVDDEARRVHGKRRLLQLVALLVDLDQAGGGDLVEEHAVGVDQEMILRSRHARRDVRVHEVFPAEVRDEPFPEPLLNAKLDLVPTAWRNGLALAEQAVQPEAGSE